MIVLTGPPFEWEVATDTAVTIGVFDGVHVGHRRVIADLIIAGGIGRPQPCHRHVRPASACDPRSRASAPDADQRRPADRSVPPPRGGDRRCSRLPRHPPAFGRRILRSSAVPGPSSETRRGGGGLPVWSGPGWRRQSADQGRGPSRLRGLGRRPVRKPRRCCFVDEDPPVDRRRTGRGSRGPPRAPVRTGRRGDRR